MSDMTTGVDVAIVGGGLGGSALGGYLARAGMRVLLLEQLTQFEDRVRGEWMAPWGVAELKRVGLYDRFMAAGGHHLRRSIGYDELLQPAQAEAMGGPMTQLRDDIPGPLCMQHVVMQNESLAAAIEAGVDVRRGISRVKVVAGATPQVSFVHGRSEHSVSCRLIVGADGRGSTVRRQLSIPMNEAPLDHLLAGLLIEGAHGWPEDLQSVGKVGDIHYLVFPQGGGRVRLYADYAYAGRARFTGTDGAQEMLALFNMPQVPHSEVIAKAQPVGPCKSWPSQDAWVDVPCVEGAVLIGDSAGYNDPILGQGMSVTLRDVRMVGETLVGSNDWSVEQFRPYVEERQERMRRLRYTASFATTLNARFGEVDVQRRIRAMTLFAEQPELAGTVGAAFMGPERIPAELFTAEHYERVFGTREYLVA